MTEKLLRWMATNGSQLSLETMGNGHVKIILDTQRNDRPLLRSITYLTQKEITRRDIYPVYNLLDAVEQLVEGQEKTMSIDAKEALDA